MVLLVENEVVLFMDGPHPTCVGGEMKDCMDSLHCGTADNGVPQVTAHGFVADWPFEPVLASDVDNADPAYPLFI